MKIIFEFPDNILEEEDLNQYSFFKEQLKTHIAQQVKSQLVDKYMEKATMEDLDISHDELRQAVLDRMVKKVLNKEEE